MASNRSLRSLLVSASLALVALVGAGVAQARDVNWSLGVSSPGVVVDVDNGRGVRVIPAPVYLAPPPPPPRAVYYPAPPQPVYYAPPPRPVYYAPPAYVAPPPGYYHRERGRHHRHHNHNRGHGRGHDDRRGGWERR